MQNLAVCEFFVLQSFEVEVLTGRPPAYIDLYLIHSPLSGKEKRLETYKALLEARNSGKIKTVGVSN